MVFPLFTTWDIGGQQFIHHRLGPTATWHNQRRTVAIAFCARGSQRVHHPGVFHRGSWIFSTILMLKIFYPHQVFNTCEWYLKWRNPHICFSSMDTASLWKGIPKPRTALIPVRYLQIRYLNPWQPLGPLLKVQLLVGPTCKIPRSTQRSYIRE